MRIEEAFDKFDLLRSKDVIYDFIEWIYEKNYIILAPEEQEKAQVQIIQTLCQILGDLIGYKHKKKRYYKVLVVINDKEYDVYDLIEQAKTQEKLV